MARTRFQINFRFPRGIHDRLTRESERTGQTKTEIVVNLLDRHLPGLPEDMQAFPLEGSMQVQIVSGGRVLPVHFHNGLHYVEAPTEGEYVIRLHNPTNRRQMVVLSVDGLNVINGDEASYDDTDAYVLNPRQTWDIKGWRRSANEVAAFEFTAREDGYSNQMGKGLKNVGVIGAAVFYEKEIETKTSGALWAGTVPCSATFDASTSKSVKPRRSKASKTVATGYGAKTEMRTSTTTFDKAQESPNEVITLRYGTREQLIEWGVPLRPSTPNPFPGEAPAVPAPPGWVG